MRFARASAAEKPGHGLPLILVFALCQFVMFFVAVAGTSAQSCTSGGGRAARLPIAVPETAPIKPASRMAWAESVGQTPTAQAGSYVRAASVRAANPCGNPACPGHSNCEPESGSQDRLPAFCWEPILCSVIYDVVLTTAATPIPTP
jgi:hypothetical protein